MKVGFIGMGNMGFAFMQGLLKQKEKSDIRFTCRRKSHGEEIERQTGVSFSESNALVTKESDILILAVKPVVYAEVLQEIKTAIKKDQIVISFAPGISVREIQEQLGGFSRIVRAMPNTPATVSEGMTGISYDETLFSEAEREEIERIFLSVGKAIKTEERLMDAVTVVSGSAPALIYELIDTLADAGVKYGMKKGDALNMAAQTALGSAKLLLESGEHPAVLKDRVCSPGGTTIAAMTALWEAGFRRAVLKGAEACYKASRG